MIAQLLMKEFWYALLGVAIAFVFGYIWSSLKQEFRKEKQAKEEQSKIKNASAVELLGIYEVICALEEWNDAVDKGMKARVLQLLDTYVLNIDSVMSKEVSEDCAYREVLQTQYQDIVSLIAMLYALELEANAKRAEDVFDRLTRLTPSYLEAIKRTKIKDDLQKSLEEGYKKLTLASEVMTDGKGLISNAIEEAKSKGLDDVTVDSMVEKVKQKKNSL